MPRIIFIGLLCAFIFLLASCAPPIVVSNKTSFAVRVIVSGGGVSQTVSPSPGESSIAEIGEGAYKATVIPDAEWIEYAKLTRKVLNEQLANSDNLTGAQLLDVIRRLKDIALRMQQYEQAAGGSASCGGRITEDKGGGVVTVSAGADGKLAISCR